VTAISFAINWDYRCPYARNANEHVIEALEAGAEWDVQFLSFSLDQTHVAEGDPAVWDNPDRYPGLLANEAGIIVRDRQPDKFLAVHQALFTARHDRSQDLRDRAVLGEVLAGAGVDPTAVFEAIDDGWPLETFRKEHEAAVDDLQVFGVPTFIVGRGAVFVRLLNRPEGDAALATRTIERVVNLIGDFPELNEFKYSSIPR
jgi:predicted DsbA family dithiol-disulfide isomerase